MEVRHPRWNTVLVGPRIGGVNPKESHLYRRTSSTVEGNDVNHGGDHCMDAGNNHDNTDFSPSVSESCEDGGTAKVD